MTEWQIKIMNNSDGIEFWHLKRKLHQETEFLRLSPEEKKETPEDEIKRIQSSVLERRLMLAVYLKNEIIGYLLAQANIDHTFISHVTVGILQEYTGIGIGKSLIKEMESWACSCKFTRIKLEVMTHNIPALQLYKQLGYQIIDKKSYLLYESEKMVQGYVLEKKLLY